MTFVHLRGGGERGENLSGGGGERCNPVSNMMHHVYKGLSGDLAREV